MFLGNPATGKTTVVRLLGRILHQAGEVSSEAFVEVDREKLVSNHIGETAQRTTEALESFLGGVLFVDEAYSLASAESSNDFGREAIETILTFMENNRDDIVVVFAGCIDRMQDFLPMNLGPACSPRVRTASASRTTPRPK